MLGNLNMAATACRWIAVFFPNKSFVLKEYVVNVWLTMEVGQQRTP